MLLSDCWFTNALGGLVDWTYSGAAGGFQSPTVAGAVDGATYLYRAQTFDGTRWEVGTGAYTASSGKFARTTVLFNSAGTTAKINFPTPPHVVIRDVGDVANTANIATNTASIASHESAWTSYTPTITASSGAFGSVSASGGYLAIGKLVHFTVAIQITAVGTASGDIIATLPLGTAAKFASAVATEFAVVGDIGFGRIAAGASTINPIRRTGNATYIGAGHLVVLTGIYERT